MANRFQTKSIKPNLSEADAASISVEISFMSATNKREIAFIDPGVDDVETLLNGIRPNVEPILLSSDEPAPRQMARTVHGREGLEAIHVIAHGRPGEVSFGFGVLSRDSLDTYSIDLRSLGVALNKSGALRLWSCEIGKGDCGSEFVQALAAAVGADVGASAGPS
jgi:hypothetical protein